MPGQFGVITIKHLTLESHRIRATSNQGHIEGGYPRLFEESPSPQLAAEQTGDYRRFCVHVKFTF